MARLRAAQEKILDRRSAMDELRARRWVRMPEPFQALLHCSSSLTRTAQTSIP